MRLKADLTLLFVALIWGFSFIVQRTAAQQVGMFVFNAVRWSLGALIMLPFVRFRLNLNRSTLPWMLAGGALLFFASGFQQAGLEYTTAGNAGFITGAYVVIIPLLLSIFWKEKQPWYIWLAALITSIGVYLLGGAGRLDINLGDALVLAGAVLWALHVIITGKGVKKLRVLQFVTGQYLVCAIINITFGLWLQQDSIPRLFPAWMHIVYLAIAATGIGFTLQAYGQQHAPPADAAIILSMETVFAGLFGWLLLSEKMTSIQLVGCSLIMGAILLSQLIGGREASPTRLLE